MQAATFSAIAALAVGLSLSGCATTSTGAAGTATSPNANVAANVPANLPQRDLTAPEKKAIMDAVGPSLRDPATAKYRWAKVPAVITDPSINYCAIVTGKSPFPAYSGEQTYIVEAKVVGGHVTSAVMGLIAGGKDKSIVSTMCAKYGLDPAKSS